MYDAESNQEGFLVLSGECIAIDRTIHYPVEPLAASVVVATDSPREAYAGGPPIVPARSPWPLS